MPRPETDPHYKDCGTSAVMRNLGVLEARLHSLCQLSQSGKSWLPNNPRTICNLSSLAYQSYLNIQGKIRHLPSNILLDSFHQNSTPSKYLVPLKELEKRFKS